MGTSCEATPVPWVSVQRHRPNVRLDAFTRKTEGGGGGVRYADLRMSVAGSRDESAALGAEHEVQAILRRADGWLAEAQKMIEALDLVGRWSAVGRPLVVGSVAYGLVVEPDIDMEIYMPQPSVAAGFSVATQLALVPGVRRVRFANELDGPDQGLYFQVRYRDPRAEGATEWKVDMWLLADSYAGPRSSALVEPMRRALDLEKRAAILRIKEAKLGREEVHGIDVYRAVLEGGVRTPDEYDAWLAEHGAAGLTSWRPGAGG